jgi:endonuclease/exonuclease/phosphatase family metal-dependent hydrolase
LTLTALTYNLRNGGGDRGERLDAIAEVIAEAVFEEAKPGVDRAADGAASVAASGVDSAVGGGGGVVGGVDRRVDGGAGGPDVVALQELGRSPRHARAALRRLADALGMRAYAARSWLPGGQPVGLLVRPTARVLAASVVPGPFHHGAVRVVLDTDLGPLAVLSTHLCPYSGRRRRWEAGWLARAARPSAPVGGTSAYGDPAAPAAVLLMGDLNSLDPRTDHTATLARLPRAYRRRHVRRDGSADTRAVAALEGAGLTDLFAQVGEGPGRTVPTDYAGTEFGGTEFGGTEFGGTGGAGMRLDYALASAPVARLGRACVVVTTGAARTASDHYPLLTRLAVRPVLARP